MTDAELDAAIEECREYWRYRLKIFDIAGVSSDSPMRKMPKEQATRLALLLELKELRAREQKWVAAWDDLRDAVLNGRGAMAEEDNYEPNSVLAEIDCRDPRTPTAAQRQET